jgi:hypothetical protein
LAEAVVAATKKERLLRKRAAAAAFTLLGVPPTIQAAAPTNSSDASPDRWSSDLSFMRYAESERITVVEPQVGVRRDFSDNRSLSILATVDVITGSTPLGTVPATPNTAPNTVTGASGQGTNPIVGKIPLSKMTDTRIGLDATWEQPVAENYNGQFGASASKETDFISLGANTMLARDFNEKNTTLSFGVAPEFDISNPNGGLPVPFATFGTPGSIDGTRDTKWLASGLAGLTQVINRRTLMQFNYTYTYEHGYLTDPYKLISLINYKGDPVSALYESRPQERMEHSLYWLTRYNIVGHDVFSLGFRYYIDDWGIHSQTLDFSYRRQSNDHFYWEPIVRYYNQSAASFFHSMLDNLNPIPSVASSDLRLAALQAVTFGVHFGYTFKDGSEMIVRGEYYIESGDSHPSDATGAQRSYDLYPTLYASIIQVDYHFEPAKLFSKKNR